jgi:hypothetical protein
MGIFSFVKPGKKVFQTIKSVKPNVPTTKKQKLLSKLKKTTQTVKGATAKLKQTQFERANPQFKGPSFTFETTTKKTPSNTELKDQADYLNKTGKYKVKKATGGRVGRKFGSPKPKTNVEKIKEAFSTKGLKKIDPKKQKGLAKLKKARPDVVRKMGYFKRGGRS